MSEGVNLRPSEPGDLPDLRRIYAESIRILGPERYGPEAIEAWASFAKAEGFREFVFDCETLIAEDEEGIAGFGGIDDEGRIASLFVRPEKARRGIASRILRGLLEIGGRRGISHFRTEASALSHPLFEKFGFRVVEEEITERAGVRIKRFRMERVDS